MASIRSSPRYTCARCLRSVAVERHSHQIRTFSHSAANPPPAAPPAAAFAPLQTRRLISLHGQDAGKYLQGLIAANVPRSSTELRAGFYSAFLNASGRVLHDVFIYPTYASSRWRDAAAAGMEQEGGFLIEVDGREVDALAKHLKRYKLRAKIVVRVVEEGEWVPWSAWGGGSGQEEEGGSQGPLSMVDERLPRKQMGTRLILPAGAKPETDAEEVSNAGYDLRRISLGVPEGQGEILKEAALPQESDIDYMGGIDFRKGCYVGQELTIRTHHTGVVRKRILPVQLYDTDSKPPATLSYDSRTAVALPVQGANISRIGRKGRTAGKWLGGVGNVGLALCRLEIMTDTVLTGEGSQWDPTSDFKVSWYGDGDHELGDVKIKAFVPSWHHERANAQRVQRPNG